MYVLNIPEPVRSFFPPRWWPTNTPKLRSGVFHIEWNTQSLSLIKFETPAPVQRRVFHMVFVVTYTECLISRCQYLQIVTYQTRVVKEKFWHLKLHSHFLLLPTIHFMLSDLVFSWVAHPTLPPSLTAPPPGPHGPSTSISVSDTHYTQIPPPWLWSFAAPSQSDLLLSLKCCCVHSRHHLAEFSTSCASASLSRFHKKELTCKYF